MTSVNKFDGPNRAVPHYFVSLYTNPTAMKLKFTVVLILTCMMCACNKVRTCDCKRTDKISNVQSTENYTFRSKKKDAKSTCDSYTEDTQFEKVECDLK